MKALRLFGVSAVTLLFLAVTTVDADNNAAGDSEEFSLVCYQSQCDDTSCCDAGCDSTCASCGGCGCGSCYLFGPDEPFELMSGDGAWGIRVAGWTQVGYTEQSTGLFNSIPDKVNLHQQWCYVEKAADGKRGWDWGFRADVMYGIDGDDTQAFGNNPGRWDFLNDFDHGVYGFAIPQAYAELANGNFSVKVGHFFTIVGYEVVTAPDNFFYSHAFTMYNSEPFTHTGALATYEASDNVTLYGGWTLGWDTGFDQFNDGSNFLGGIGLSLTDNCTLTYVATAGNLGWRGDGYSHSLVLDVSVTDRLNYVLQSDYVSTNGNYDVATGRFFGRVWNDDIGVNQYLIYRLNDCWGVGGRLEWWKQDGVSVNEWTVGVNYKPLANFIVRPEFRQQWAPAANYQEAIFGMDAIITY